MYHYIIRKYAEKLLLDIKRRKENGSSQYINLLNSGLKIDLLTIQKMGLEYLLKAIESKKKTR